MNRNIYNSSKKGSMKPIIILVVFIALMGSTYLYLSNRAAYADVNSNLNIQGTTALDKNNIAVVSGDYQEVGFDLTSSGYESITVQKGIPVKFHIRAEQQNINSCNGTLIIPEFNSQVDLKAGDNVVEFTPTKVGTIPYSCWMGMINSSIIVVDDLSKVNSGQLAIPKAAVIGTHCCKLTNRKSN